MKPEVKMNKGSNKRKFFVPTVGVLVILCVLAIAKAIFLNPPKESPKQITQKIVDLIQKKDASDKDKQEIRKYYKPSVLEKFNKDVPGTNTQGNNESKNDVVVTIKSVEEQKETATATIEMEAWIIKVPVQFKFTKDGNFLKGYKWMINDIIGAGDSSGKKESNGKADEKLDIGGGFKMIVSQPSDFTPYNSWDRPDDGMKFIAVELTYFNESDKSDSVSPSNLALRDSDSHSYEITYKTEKKPQLESGTVVTAGNSVKGFIVYEVPKDAKINNAVYSNSASTVTINF